MTDLILFWHRRDLRIEDNVGLAAARSKTPKVVGVFCLDPVILDQRDRVAPAQVVYMVTCLQELEAAYRGVGSRLIFIFADPIAGIPQLAQKLNAKGVHWNLDTEPYATHRDSQVSQALRRQGTQVHTFWDQLLHAPGTVLTQAGKAYTVFGPFAKNWHTQPKPAVVASLQNCQDLSPQEVTLSQEAGAIALPTPAALGYSWDNPLPIEGGAIAAHTKLQAFCGQGIYNYDDQRNFPAEAGTSLLSAPLRFGAIGIRTVWQEAVAAIKDPHNPNAGITTWHQELVWREFYHHVLYFFPELADGPYRDPFKNFPWDNNPQHFEAWCAGQTGYPIIDAAMAQLNHTGWMHNRCRMIVASFLTKDLIINWQWGEQYFMSKLIDGELAANNGGWQWSASSGMDPKPLRIFNPYTQAQKFDPDGAYIRRWLPHLKTLETKSLLTGNISDLTRQAHGYVPAIVDHSEQQRKFKALYAQQKNEKKVS